MHRPIFVAFIVATFFSSATPLGPTSHHLPLSPAVHAAAPYSHLDSRLRYGALAPYGGYHPGGAYSGYIRGAITPAAKVAPAVTGPAVAAAAYPGYALRPDLAETPKPYNFGFTANTHDGAVLNRQEDADGSGVVRGSYGYTDASGIFRQVDYIADGLGFRANVRTNEPGTANESPADVNVQADPVIVQHTATRPQVPVLARPLAPAAAYTHAAAHGPLAAGYGAHHGLAAGYGVHHGLAAGALSQYGGLSHSALKAAYHSRLGYHNAKYY